MAEDQSVVGRRRIYYDPHGSEALICSDSEEEKREFSEGEDRILWMAFEEHGLNEEVLNILTVVSMVLLVGCWSAAPLMGCVQVRLAFDSDLGAVQPAGFGDEGLLAAILMVSCNLDGQLADGREDNYVHVSEAFMAGIAAGAVESVVSSPFELIKLRAQIGPLRCWPGGLCLSRSIGDLDVGEFIVPIPYVKQVKAVNGIIQKDHPRVQEEEETKSYEDDDNDDFEFLCVCKDPTSTDEIFYNSQIRLVFPIFGRDLLFSDVENCKGEMNSSKPPTPSPIRIPEDRNPPSCSSPEADELDGVPAGTYCV
ncbi:Histone-lysine N-methyltransferase EZ3 [Camellia lanceoleosa]|uniref:Histone-lysine N-methyltransferase EZ3 n=1 Tax=Camellia lanceoleosa TaxID=1840588 RepID=A0ACC0IRW5_9ERIC|nr:Histone-lysine N-methyltransferase EZ3 [Camellia lanceoleosa]